VPERESNRAIIEGWLASWTPRVEEAAEALADVYDLPPLQVARFEDVFAKALRTQSGTVTDLGLDMGVMA
jgi:methane monooxygenase component A beta chain/propane monooxygenase small subunit